MSRKKKKSIPHLFAKLIVAACVGCGTAFSFYAFRILSRTGHDPSSTLALVLAFFGGELLFLCLKTILSNKKEGKSE